MNGLTKLSKAQSVKFVQTVRIPPDELVAFLVKINKENNMSKLNPAYETATHEFVKQDYTTIKVGPIPDEYKLITSDKKPWCEIHQREATYMFRGKPVCDPNLGGIMMSCQCRD